jgi:ABC-2 type transport system ATP-binding protein
VLEQIVYLGRLHGWSQTAARTSAMELIERLGLEERANDTVESLSLGNQQRAQIAAALVHEPEVLVLDEPFSGLDPMAVDVVLGVLQSHAASGAPVLFSSHQLDIVERLCDDLVIIADGEIRANGSVEGLRREHGSSRHELLLGGASAVGSGTGDAGWVRDVPGVTVIDFDGGYALFEAGDDARAAVLARAVASGELVSFGPHEPSLAQVFREVIR